MRKLFYGLAILFGILLTGSFSIQESYAQGEGMPLPRITPCRVPTPDAVFNPNTNMLFLPEYYYDSSSHAISSGHVLAINENNESDSILNEKGLVTIDVNPKTNTLYATVVFVEGVYQTDEKKNALLYVIDGSTLKITKTIELNFDPTDLVIDSKTNMLYFLDSKSRKIEAFDGTSYDFVNSIDVGISNKSDFIGSLALNSDTNTIYLLASYYEKDSKLSKDEIYVIDGSGGSVKGIISVSTKPTAFEVNINTNTLYVADSGNRKLTVIDGSSNKVVDIIDTGYQSTGLTINPNTNSIFVTNCGDSSISVINGLTNNLVQNIEIEGFPKGVVVNSNSNDIYVYQSGWDSAKQYEGDYYTEGQIIHVLRDVEQTIFDKEEKKHLEKFIDIEGTICCGSQVYGNNYRIIPDDDEKTEIGKLSRASILLAGDSMMPNYNGKRATIQGLIVDDYKKYECEKFNFYCYTTSYEPEPRIYINVINILGDVLKKDTRYSYNTETTTPISLSDISEESHFEISESCEIVEKDRKSFCYLYEKTKVDTGHPKATKTIQPNEIYRTPAHCLPTEKAVNGVVIKYSDDLRVLSSELVLDDPYDVRPSHWNSFNSFYVTIVNEGTKPGQYGVVVYCVKIENIPPKQLMMAGIAVENIECNNDLIPIYKISKYTVACVKFETAQKLVEREWGNLEWP